MSTLFKILQTYDMLEAVEPDISTERLLQMTADECKCDVAEVCDALHARSLQTPKVKCGQIVVSDGKTFRVVATDGPDQIRAIPFPGDNNANSGKLSAWSKK